MKHSPMRPWTFEEVNAHIPELEKVFKSWMMKKQNYLKRHEEIFFHEILKEVEASLSAEPDDGKQLLEEIQAFESAIPDLTHDIRALRALGGFLRSAHAECVDFYGQKDGKPIYFCWKEGEKTVTHFHEIQDRRFKRLPFSA